jgi:hypothetical protein
MYPSLSALVPPVVDHLYNIDSASPDERPTFLWLVGSPGAGKSSGHSRAIDAGLIPAGNYATINLDTLLESLTPFRAASAMGHYVKRAPAMQETGAKFSSIFAYGTRKENMGLFKWYNTAHGAIAAADPPAAAKLNRVRAEFAPLDGREAAAKLTEINEAAIERAVSRGVNIVYETTLSLNKSKKVQKVEDVMALLKAHGPQYRVVFYHVYGDPAEVAARIQARQEYGMPYEDMPFYRYVAASPELVGEYAEKTAEAFTSLRKQYGPKGVVFDEWANPMDPARLPPAREFNAPAQLKRITRAYASRRSTSSQKLRSSQRVSTPSSSSNRGSLRYSTPTSERARRRSTRRRSH